MIFKLSQGKRPIVADKTEAELHTFIAEHLSCRESSYAQAQYVVETDFLNLNDFVLPFLEKLI